MKTRQCYRVAIDICRDIWGKQAVISMTLCGWQRDLHQDIGIIISSERKEWNIFLLDEK
jgi:hypothetical protein